MKTNFVLGLTITTLMFTGCSRDEVSSINNSDAKSIGFEISTGKTRAVVADIGALQKSDDGFGVFSTSGASSATFIDNKAYKYEDGLWKWAEQSYQWSTEEDDYPVNFYAYYPYSDATLTSSLTAKYTVAETPEKQVDLLAAKQTGVTVKPASGDVSLSFKHILSKIDFRVVTGSDVTVHVQSIAVRNVGDEGTFSLANLEWTIQPFKWNSGYNYMKAPVKEPANVFVGQTSSREVTGSSGSLMLMPQNLSGRGWDKKFETLNAMSYIEVVYRVHETATGNDIVGYSDAEDHPQYLELGDNYKGALFVKVGYPLPTDWQMGKAYTYTIFLADGNSSGGNLIEENFIDEDGEKTDLPVVNPETEEPIVPPEPIFPDNDRIGFVVSVDNWGETIENSLK